ncbi:hypothetical protein JXO52_10255 [bacterium]|nr:hypothetical protein [bacterium]
MPITCTFRPDCKLAVFSHIGDVPDDEFLMSYKRYIESPDFKKGWNLLIDLRRTTSTARGSDALRKMADFIKAQLAGIMVKPKVAVLAPTDLSFGLARMYEVFSDEIIWDFTVFRSLDAALAWVGAPEDLLD